MSDLYNHNTMNSHDSRAHNHRRVKSLLCILAASLGANNVVVDAFSIASSKPSATSKSKSALDISTSIPHHIPQSSLADRFLEDFSTAVQPQPVAPKKPKQLPTPSSISSKPKALPEEKLYNVLPIELNEEEVRKRKLEWAGRYTSVEALRQTFGSNENKLWGDLQASTARRLYKTLLPRALLELSQLGVGQLQPQDLAPLAYQARVAAKLYARERCTVPARLGATLFDGFRQWMKYGKFQAHGMTYDQLWQKYAERICHETEHPEEDVCLMIIERSCVSNEGVDNLVLKRKASNESVEEQQQRLLERIHAQLEQDMYELLLPPKVLKKSITKATRPKRPWSKRNHVLMVRLLARQQRIQQRRLEQQRKEEALKP